MCTLLSSVIIMRLCMVFRRILYSPTDTIMRNLAHVGGMRSKMYHLDLEYYENERKIVTKKTKIPLS